MLGIPSLSDYIMHSRRQPVWSLCSCHLTLGNTTPHHSTPQHSTAQHSTAQHSTPHHTTPHHTTPHLFYPHRYDTPWCPVPDALSWPQQAGRLVELDRQPEQATNAMRGLELPHPRNDRAPPFHIGRRPRSLLLAQAPAPQTKDFSSCTQGPRRRPEAMRPAKDPVW